MIIIAGSNGNLLAQSIAQHLSATLVTPKINRFADDELKIEIEETLANQQVVIIQSTSSPVNDNLMELLLLISHAKLSMAKQITVVVPYFGYARQDRSENKLQPLSAQLVAKIIETAGAGQVISFDCHSAHLASYFFQTKFHNIEPVELLQQIIPQDVEVIVAPDQGAINRTQIIAQRLNLPIAFIEKIRLSDGKCQVKSLTGATITGKNCLIVDDIIDTGNTVANATKILRQHGAKNINLYASHGVFSSDALTLLKETNFDKIMISNSIPCMSTSNLINICDISEILSSTFSVI